MINKGLPCLLFLLKAQNISTRKHAAGALRDLSGNDEYKMEFSKHGCIESLAALGGSRESELQTLAFASLRHLSLMSGLHSLMIECDIVEQAVRHISMAAEDLQCQIAGLFANLSESREHQTGMVKNGVVQAIVALA
eukprot:15302634-Ditylum_brightwellii.AAC.1